MMYRACVLAAITPLAFASCALAQVATAWCTIDCGGGRLTGGSFLLQGSIGQPDATCNATSAGAIFGFTGGFWPGHSSTCVADFDRSGAVTVPDLFDFLDAWFALSPAADVNGVAGVSVQDLFDFLDAWFAGC